MERLHHAHHQPTQRTTRRTTQRATQQRTVHTPAAPRHRRADRRPRRDHPHRLLDRHRRGRRQEPPRHTTQDGDSYTGGYKADYSKFTGEEAVFGGTGKKASIHLNGTITGTSGTGRILVTNGSDTKRPVPATNGKIDQTYNVTGTSFYIYVTGDQFTGTVNLTSKEQ